MTAALHAVSAPSKKISVFSFAKHVVQMAHFARPFYAQGVETTPAVTQSTQSKRCKLSKQEKQCSKSKKSKQAKRPLEHRDIAQSASPAQLAQAPLSCALDGADLFDCVDGLDCVETVPTVQAFYDW